MVQYFAVFLVFSLSGGSLGTTTSPQQQNTSKLKDLCEVWNNYSVLADIFVFWVVKNGWSDGFVRIYPVLDNLFRSFWVIDRYRLTAPCFFWASRIIIELINNVNLNFSVVKSAFQDLPRRLVSRICSDLPSFRQFISQFLSNRQMSIDGCVVSVKLRVELSFLGLYW